MRVADLPPSPRGNLRRMTPVYLTASELRAGLALTAAQLPDAAADTLTIAAEDLVDALLGARPVDSTTGRKVAEDAVDAWQWDRLQRATIAAAGKIRADPELLTRQAYQSVSGPDFAYSGAASYVGTLRGRLGLEVTIPLDGSGLGVYGVRVGRIAKPLSAAGWPYDAALDSPELDGDEWVRPR